MVRYGFLDAKAEFGGFGSRRLISQSFLGAKAGHPDQRFCRWKLLFYQQPCAKAKEFGEAEFWDSMPVFYGGILFCFGKAGENSTFSKVVKLQGRGVLAPEPPCLVQMPCAKT